MLLVLLISLFCSTLVAEECRGYNPTTGVSIDKGTCIPAGGDCQGPMIYDNVCTSSYFACCGEDSAGEAEHAALETELSTDNARLYECFREHWDRPSGSPDPFVVRFLPYLVFDDSKTPAGLEKPGFGWASHAGVLEKIPSGAGAGLLGAVGTSLPVMAYDHEKLQLLMNEFGAVYERFSGRQYQFEAASYERVLLVPSSKFTRSFADEDPVGAFFRENTEYEPNYAHEINFCPQDASVKSGGLPFLVNLNPSNSKLVDANEVSITDVCSSSHGRARCSLTTLIDEHGDMPASSMRSWFHHLAHSLFAITHDRCADMTMTLHTEYGHPATMLGLAKVSRTQTRSAVDGGPLSHYEFPTLAAASQAYAMGYIDSVKAVAEPGVYKLEPFDMLHASPQSSDAKFLLELSSTPDAGEGIDEDSPSLPAYLILISFEYNTAGLEEGSTARGQRERGAVTLTFHEKRRDKQGYQRGGTMIDTTPRSHPFAHVKNMPSSMIARDCEDGALEVGQSFRVDDLDVIVELLRIERDESGSDDPAPPVAFIGISRLSDTDRLSSCGDGKRDLGEECDGGAGCVADLCQCEPGWKPSTGDDNFCVRRCGNGVIEYDEECDGGEGCDEQCKCGASYFSQDLGRGCIAELPGQSVCVFGNRVPAFKNREKTVWACTDVKTWAVNDGWLDLGEICDDEYWPETVPVERAELTRKPLAPSLCAENNLVCTAGGRPRIHVGRPGDLSDRWRIPDAETRAAGRPGDRVFDQEGLIESIYIDPSKIDGGTYGALGGLEVRGCAPFNGDLTTAEERAARRWSDAPRMLVEDQLDLSFFAEAGPLDDADTPSNDILGEHLPAILIGGSACLLVLLVLLIVGAVLLHRRKNKNSNHNRSRPLSTHLSGAATVGGRKGAGSRRRSRAGTYEAAINNNRRSRSNSRKGDNPLHVI